MYFVKGLFYLLFIALFPVRSWRSWRRVTATILLLLPLPVSYGQGRNLLFDAAAWNKAAAKKDLTTPSKPKSGKNFALASIAFFGCGLADTLTTERALRFGRGAEGNPLIRGSTGTRQTISWAARGVAYAIFYRYRKRAPGLTRTALWTGAGLGCGAAAWNSRQK